MNAATVISRRAVAAGTGGAGPRLFVANGALAQTLRRRRRRHRRRRRFPAASSKRPYLDSWIRIDANGAITVFTGKAELGQGINTALMQCAAEQLDVSPDRIKLVTADTARTAERGLHRR